MTQIAGLATLAIAGGPRFFEGRVLARELGEPVDVELSALYHFVEARVLERIRDAEARGDHAAMRTAQGSRRVLEGIRGDLVRESLAREPAVGYLVRIADRFWDHPELPEFMYRR